MCGAGKGPLPEKGLQERRELRHRRAHGSSLLGSTGMPHDGDTWKWGLEWGSPNGTPDGEANPGLMGIWLLSHPSKHIWFGSPHAQGAACPPCAPRSCYSCEKPITAFAAESEIKSSLKMQRRWGCGIAPGPANLCRRAAACGPSPTCSPEARPGAEFECGISKSKIAPPPPAKRWQILEKHQRWCFVANGNHS